MKNAIYTVLFFLFSFSNNVFAQIKIDGTLSLGDTTQLLSLKTKNGDQFVGHLQSWSVEKISFSLLTGDVLHFEVSEVAILKVEKSKKKIAPVDDGKGEFLMYLRSGFAMEGQLINYNTRSTKFKSGSRGRNYFSSEDVTEIEFLPGGRRWKFDNDFSLVFKNGEKIKGRLLHMDESSLHFQPYDGEPMDVARSQVQIVNQIKSYRPMYGHRRALLLTPTGFNLRKGEGELRSISYVHNSYAVGFSDNFSGTFGLMGVEPYVQFKGSYDFGKYLHMSAGVGVSLGGAAGWFVSASIGTPDYYFNFGFTDNKGELIYEYTDMDAMYFGGSLRVGNRQRLVGEFTHLAERGDMFDANGFGTNTFAFAYGWFSRRVSLNIGVMMVENSDEVFCSGSGSVFFFGPCDGIDFYYTGIPVLSTSIMFGKNFK